MPKLTTPRDMFEEYEADIIQVAFASVVCLIVSCGAMKLNLNTFFQLVVSFAFKCAASIPICSWLNKESGRVYVKLFLITLELSIFLIKVNIDYVLIEAIISFSLVAYS